MESARRKPRPLDAAKLDELALSYVARFATTRAKLVSYLRRKVRERGWAETGEPAYDAIADRLVQSRYIDDEGYARAKSRSLLRRGYGVRRVNDALGAAGVAPDLREDLRPDEAAQREAALAMARKRRFGPFGQPVIDQAVRQKQIAAMVRAGHPLDKSRELIDAGSVEAAEAWAAQGD